MKKQKLERELAEYARTIRENEESRTYNQSRYDPNVFTHFM